MVQAKCTSSAIAVNHRRRANPSQRFVAKKPDQGSRPSTGVVAGAIDSHLPTFRSHPENPYVQWLNP
jgi:hypothetical protein